MTKVNFCSGDWKRSQWGFFLFLPLRTFPIILGKQESKDRKEIIHLPLILSHCDVGTVLFNRSTIGRSRTSEGWDRAEGEIAGRPRPFNWGFRICFQKLWCIQCHLPVGTKNVAQEIEYNGRNGLHLIVWLWPFWPLIPFPVQHSAICIPVRCTWHDIYRIPSMERKRSGDMTRISCSPFCSVIANLPIMMRNSWRMSGHYTCMPIHHAHMTFSNFLDFPSVFRVRTCASAHTVLFFKIYAIEIGHQFRAQGIIGIGQDYISSEYEQTPTSLFWEKLKNCCFTIKSAVTMSSV